MNKYQKFFEETNFLYKSVSEKKNPLKRKNPFFQKEKKKLSKNLFSSKNTKDFFFLKKIVFPLNECKRIFC